MHYALKSRRALAWLLVINVAVWLIVTILRIPVSPLPVNTEPWLSLPAYFPLFLSRPWTLLTYMAVQYDFLHLLFNVLWLYWFGIILLNTLSDRSLLWLYIGGGICGGLLFLAAAPLGWSSGWLCGSSASVLAVMAAAAVRMPDHRLNLFLIGPVRLKWVAIVCGALTFLGGGGSQAAHLGGLLFGLTFSLKPLKPLPCPPRRGGSSLSRLLSLKPHPCPPRRGGSSLSRLLSRLLSPLRGEPEGGFDSTRLDQLLDKIRISGYESLSRRERTELQSLSSRLKR